MNKKPEYAATLAKRTKRPYIKKALLKDRDRTIKLALKPRRKKVVDSC